MAKKYGMGSRFRYAQKTSGKFIRTERQFKTDPTTGKRIAGTTVVRKKTITQAEYEQEKSLGRRTGLVVSMGGQLDSGFNALLSTFRRSGTDEGMINRLAREWSRLTLKQKERFYELWRGETIDRMYASSSESVNTNTPTAMEDDWYPQLADRLIGQVMAETMFSS